MSSGRDPRFEIDFGQKMYSLHGCNKSLYFDCKGDNFRVEESLTYYFLKLSKYLIMFKVYLIGCKSLKKDNGLVHGYYTFLI